ncbi:hypothetical protein MWU78_21360 [Arenibacter sp. F26102]|uniref:hypothetical protein n=1 Tax=Arenibacter sp. F26102 TaxID=2926416 RepID=UPI001FF6B8BD|nr:hypothetical protein [Arenibacter sp. F26102]MCK0148209.1 hypothetical protein [Arenibacter sp. F26102]
MAPCKKEASDSTQLVTWQMLTGADVEIVKGGAILRQDGKQLKLENLSHPEITVSVVSVHPAPLEIDRQIESLKRIELRLPAYAINDRKTMLRIRLSGD